jgi:homoserine dehydrogenase
MRPIRVGLLGLGTVGQAVARALLERQELLARASFGPLVLTRAAVRDLSKPRAVPADQVTTDPFAVVRADDVDVVVELIGGEEPARALIEEALSRGKAVVTANKRVVSWHGPKLLQLAAENGAELRYEAAVGGGIPIIAPLTDDLAANRVVELRAIINGTTNYILTQMASGRSLEDALAQAQALGFAEADPRDDIDAVDAGDKLAILVRLAFGTSCTPAQVFRQGLRGLDAKDLAYGRELGYVLKLVALARHSANGIEARVHPTFLPADHPLARIDGAQNALHVTGDLCGPVMFSGQGAGGDATASAVLADLTHVARRIALGDPAPALRKSGPEAPIAPIAQASTRCYFRLAVEDAPGVFAQITQVLAAHAIGLASVIQREPGKLGSAEVVLLTYAAPESALAAAEAELAKLPCMRRVAARIRVESGETKGAR